MGYVLVTAGALVTLTLLRLLGNERERALQERQAKIDKSAADAAAAIMVAAPSVIIASAPKSEAPKPVPAWSAGKPGPKANAKRAA